MAFFNYFIWFIIFSLAGWIIDTFYRSFKAKRYAPNTYVPYISPLYAFGAFGLIALFRFTDMSFLGDVIVGGLCITVFEYLAGWGCLNIVGKRLWDYSKTKWNLHGHIDALHTLIWFGLVAILRILLPYLAL